MKPRIFLNRHRHLSPYWPAALWVCEGDGVVGFGLTMKAAYYTWLERWEAARDRRQSRK